MSTNKISENPDPSPGDAGDLKESEAVLEASAELEEALREAAEAVDGSGRASGKSSAPESTPESAPESVSEQAPEAEAESPDETQAALKLAQDRLIRLQADFENFRRRALKERTEARQYGHQNLVKDLLSSVDNLERAIEHSRGASASGTGGLESLLQGVEMVQRELLGAMAKHGVNEVEAERKPFDPAVHEAMAQFQDDSVPVNTVVEVLEKGYQLRSRLIRPARVVVSVSSSQEADEKGEDETTE
jgi:molecular chaperone GrpE